MLPSGLATGPPELRLEHIVSDCLDVVPLSIAVERGELAEMLCG